MFLLHWPTKKGPNKDCVIWLRHCFINALVCYTRLMFGFSSLLNWSVHLAFVLNVVVHLLHSKGACCNHTLARSCCWISRSFEISNWEDTSSHWALGDWKIIIEISISSFFFINSDLWALGFLTVLSTLKLRMVPRRSTWPARRATWKSSSTWWRTAGRSPASGPTMEWLPCMLPPRWVTTL